MKFNFPMIFGEWLNMLMLGPSGYGKSTFLKHCAIEFMRKGGRIVWFDIYKSCFATTSLVNGSHVNLGNIANEKFFAPLKTLSQHRAIEFLCMLCEIEGINITHEIKSSISDAVQLIKTQSPDQQTLSNFINYVMDHKIKSALHEYTSNGSYALFDALDDQINLTGQWTCFEVKELFDNKAMLQVTLLYLLSYIENLSDGIPTIVIIDDAGHVFSSKSFRKWLKTALNNFRKKGISFWFAFHNVTDFDGGIRDTILNACRIKVFTPNSQILINNSIKTAYQSLGLNERQLELLGNATPCKEYMIQDESSNTQLIDLMIQPGSISQTVCGGSGTGSISLMENLIKKHGHDKAIKQYLNKKGVHCGVV